MGRLMTAGTVIAALGPGAAAVGCGEDQAPAATARSHSSQVALTVAYPGFAPWALITYEDAGGRRCHTFGTLTSHGPRVLGDSRPLEAAVAGSGRCLGRGGPVSLAISEGAGGSVRVVGGIAARGVRRIIVGGERIRPSRSGAFLVAQPSARSLGTGVEVRFRGGGRARVPLDRLVGDARD